MKVLFLNTKRRPPLGADTWIHLQIIRELDRSRVEVHAACATGPPNCPTPTYERLRELPDVRIVSANLGRENEGGSLGTRVLAVLSLLPASWSVLRLGWYIRRQGIDLIHTSDRPRDAAVCVLLSRLTPAKSFLHLHVGYNPDWMRGMLRRAIRSADARIAISEFVASTLRDSGADPSSTYVVLNGIDLTQWHPGTKRDATRQALGLDAATPVVLTVCRLFRSKGAGELIQAMHDAGDEVREAELLVVGEEMEAGYLDDLRAMVASLGLDGRVRFLGRSDDVPALMAAADVFAMPSHLEPFGLVFAEAMAMALPVVALGDGGTVEVVEDHVTGLLSVAGDRDALAANLRALLVDPEKRRSYGRTGRRRVERWFTTERMASDTADVFAEVLGRPAKQPIPGGILGASPADSGDPAGVDMQGTLGVDASGFASALDHDGYIVLRHVVSTDKLATFTDELLGEYRRAVDAGLPFKGGGLFSGHLNCFPGEGARFIYDELRDQGVIDLVRSYRPDIVDRARATLNLNLPGSVAQHYHIDDAYLKEFLICNVAVVDTDLVNGAIDVLPGTNREFYKFWRYAIERKYKLTTRVPLQRGDVIVRKSTLWHRGMPNRSTTPRPMMAITFGEIPDAPEDPFLRNGGAIEFYPNWFNTSRLGQFREKTFVRAPVTYSTYRFVTSLYSNKGYESY